MPNLQTSNSTADNARRTPAFIIELAREVLGTIDLDPASDSDANKTIQATKYYDKDGLQNVWLGRVFLNPPGGLVAPGDYRQLASKERVKGAYSSAAIWWAKLVESYELGGVTEAIFLSFNLEIFLNAQKFYRMFGIKPPQAYPFCVPDKRVCYPSANGGKANSPMGASAIFYLGQNRNKFRTVFGKIGYCT